MKYAEATGELSKLLHDLSLAAKVISLEVNKAGLVDIIGFTGDNNVHGEQVKKARYVCSRYVNKSYGSRRASLCNGF